MSRLFTFGCSFTSYFYPTWADLLAQNYEHYENWGLIGTGTRSAAERLAECHAKNHITADDHVIVQWSLHNRHDYYNPISRYKPYAINWKTSGNIFSRDNQQVFSPDWVDKFYWEPAYVMHSLNQMILVKGLLTSLGCQWQWTSIGDWPMLGSDLGSSQGFSIAKDLAQFNCYVEELFDKPYWLKPLQTHADQQPHLGWHFMGEAWPHPSPRQYDLWLKDCLADYPGRNDAWLDELDQVYKASNKDMGRLRELMQAHEHAHWPPGAKGF